MEIRNTYLVRIWYVFGTSPSSIHTYIISSSIVDIIMSVKKRSRDSSSGGGGSGGGSSSSSSGGAAVAPGCITSFYKRRNSSSGLGDMSPTDSRFVVATDSTSSVFPRHEGGSRLCPGRSRAGESGVRFGRRCRGSKDLERDCGNQDCLRRAGFSFRVGPEVLEGTRRPASRWSWPP